MSEFLQWAVFLGFIAAIVLIIYAAAAGYIKIARFQTDTFKEWQKMNGGVVRMMCVLLLVVIVSIGIYKYYQVTTSITAPPALESD
jgi:uncharacterized PurR-regulated membrane protein YhhQ (DUF165 family)